MMTVIAGEPTINSNASCKNHTDMSLYFEDVRRHPRFKGAFNTVRVAINTDQEKGLREDFLVFSQGKRESIFRKLWLKLVWDELTSIELELLIYMLRPIDYKVYAFLKAKNLIPKIVLREKLLETETLLGETVSTRENYRSSRGQKLEIQKETRRLPKPKKFSGFIKSLSSRKGSIGAGRIELPTNSDPGVVIDHEAKEELWFLLLTRHHQ